jgi:hypothetical protein
LQGWKDNDLEDIRMFANYFDAQWGKNSLFRHWQLFHTPKGHATTNNPVESFNAEIKEQTERKRKRLITLMEHFGNWLENRISDIPPSINQSAELSSHMLWYYNSLKKRKLLHCKKVNNSLHVVQQTLSSTQIEMYAEKGSKIREYMHYYRREIKDMPKCGWKITLSCNPEKRKCNCQYFRKFGICIHYAFARENQNTNYGKQYLGKNPKRKAGRLHLASTALNKD